MPLFLGTNFPDITVHRKSGVGGDMYAPGGNLAIGPYTCCCPADCGGCGPDSRYIPNSFTMVISGWQYPTCWGPTDGVAITHEAGDINGTFTLHKTPLTLDGITYCRYLSDPIPFVLRRWFFADTNADGVAECISPFEGKTDHVILIVTTIGGMKYVAQGEGTSPMNPFGFFPANPMPKCSETLTFHGPAVQPNPPLVQGQYDTGCWGGTVTVIPNW
jgi:hypothetical protein